MNNTRAVYTITVDDDPAAHKMISRAMGINSLPYASTTALIARIDSYQPLALFVDVHLSPDECGLDAIPTFRQAWPFTPIIVVSADEADDAICNALASGANDYLRKPFHRQELTARLKARIGEMTLLSAKDELIFGPLRYSKIYRRVSCGDKSFHFSPSEALLFECLLQAKGMVVTKTELKRKVWGDVKVSDNAIDKKIFDVRKVVKDICDSVSVATTYGIGVGLTLAKPAKTEKASLAENNEG
ncbi:MAG TPA: response regulator transcription factor [Oligoflexus sp.]|uniref:response regulator transcription factor n=1 Tax=Oligoflexus sp. TaxID=1971216 RepID=UPI002D4D4BC0|nr:response regulator transcription factor [Oligoflexus sp.]HYX33900.1 response regulator transcription factor [Oligoflexus sp.]